MNIESNPVVKRGRRGREGHANCDRDQEDGDERYHYKHLTDNRKLFSQLREFAYIQSLSECFIIYLYNQQHRLSQGLFSLLILYANIPVDQNRLPFMFLYADPMSDRELVHANDALRRNIDAKSLQEAQKRAYVNGLLHLV